MNKRYTLLKEKFLHKRKRLQLKIKIASLLSKEGSIWLTVERELNNRHIQLIAIGGAIGTGLFLGSGQTIALTGPSLY